MELSEIKTKANECSVEIANALRKFQAATNETAIVSITTTEQQGRCGLLVSQEVNISIQLTD